METARNISTGSESAQVPREIVITANTTPAEALQMAYLCGHDLQAAGMEMDAFVMHLNQKIISPYSGDGLLPFLRVGFAAGYFKKPMPDVERIAARCVPTGLKRGRKPASASSTPAA